MITAVIVALVWSVAACVPQFPPPRIEVEVTEASVARGEYLANHVAICITCHSEREWKYFGGPSRPGTEGLGGPTRVDFFKLPDDVVLPAPNITPAGVGEWNDGELARAISGGLRADGSAVFPAHPYFQYRHIARGDLEAIIAYLRSMEARSHRLPERDLVYRFAEDVGNSLPLPALLRKEVPEPGSVEAGAYLVEMASCKWCHTPTDSLGWPLPGRDFAGGASFRVPEPGGGRVFAPNLTPHPSALGAWTLDDFIRRFKAATPEAIRGRPIAAGGFNTSMDWSAYSGLTAEDLEAIYFYLRTLRPRKNVVTRWQPEEAP